MKFSKIYILLSVIVLCLPIYVAHFAVTGRFPLPGSALFPDASYIVPLQSSLITALLCAVFSTLLGSALALFFTKIKEKFSVFFTEGAHYEVYIFNIIIFTILWLIIYFNGHNPGFITIAHCAICTPLVFCMIYGFSGDMAHITRCAAEIGSSPAQTFMKITLPTIAPSVISGFAASFMVSFNDVIIAPLISQGTSQTFAMKLIEYMKSGSDVGTICFLMFVLTLVLSTVISAFCIKK